MVQQITPIRRNYNRWVANQTMEDYALRFTAQSARRWSSAKVANTALGAISFLALEAIGGAITLSFGFTNAIYAIATIAFLIFMTGLPISYYAAKYGLDMDLLTRGAGFGYLGSTITSLIYASFTFIFFAIEAAIMAQALQLCFGLPLTFGYILSAIAIIPLVTHGITVISRFQTWTQPLWLLMHFMTFAFIAMQSPAFFSEWTLFNGYPEGATSGFNLIQYGSACAVVMSLVVQIGEQVDFLRFLPKKTAKNRRGWWIALVTAGPGWIIPGTIKLLAGSFLAFLALKNNVPAEIAADPPHMYLTVFQNIFHSDAVGLYAMALFVVISQLKINLTNAYAGSIAWSNFFSRLTQNHPGRVVWLVFNVIIAFMLTELGIFKALETILGIYANLAIAWIGALVADLVVNKPLGLSPPSIEFKRAHLYDINPVGIGSMFISTLLSMIAYSGALGETCKALATFIAFGVAFASAPVIAKLTNGKFYLARQPKTDWPVDALQKCCICEHQFEPQDVAHCPAYGGTICSLCCSLDARCEDICKPHAQFKQQIFGLLKKWLPPGLIAQLDSQLAQFFTHFVLIISLIATVLGLVYFQEVIANPNHYELLQLPLLKVFLCLSLIAGVTSWLSVLAKESRSMAREESMRQNLLLHQEIAAHKKTDTALKRAKEVAEAANLAKSRYLSGISHELRTPLNAILGYAQLIEKDKSSQHASSMQKRGIQVIKRSSEHLSVLIDGLLDMAKIEAGKLVLRRDSFDFPKFIEQLVQMFELQTEAKGLQLNLQLDTPLPAVVINDEKRLKQILINLISNAIKYTHEGSITLRLAFRRQIMQFEVMDTGIGIAQEEIQRIFEPFERGSTATGFAGTGLGLTISDLLAQVMGGDITVTSTLGKGSCFRLRMMLTTGTVTKELLQQETQIKGYQGSRKKILVVDDDPDHQKLMNDALSPIGFTVFSANDGAQCLLMLAQCEPDLMLLDISMPHINGWSVLKQIQEKNLTSIPIIIVSANVFENQLLNEPPIKPIEYLLKPTNVSELLKRIQSNLQLEWVFVEHTSDSSLLLQTTPKTTETSLLRIQDIEELIALGKIGYLRGIERKLTALEVSDAPQNPVLEQLRQSIKSFDFKRYINILEALHHRDP